MMDGSAQGGGEVLVLGFGNPGREDDGLGPAAVERLAALSPAGVDFDADYQLSVEDAAAAARYEVVVFIDADASGPEPFSFRPVEPTGELGISSHDCRPPAVLALARELFGARTKGYILGIRGYRFGQLAEGLSARARANLDAACGMLAGVLRERRFDAACRAFHDGPGGPLRGNGQCKTAST